METRICVEVQMIGLVRVQLVEFELRSGFPLTLVKVVDPEAMRIWRTLLWKRCMDSSSTRRKHCAVLSLVTCTQGATWSDKRTNSLNTVHICAKQS